MDDSDSSVLLIPESGDDLSGSSDGTSIPMLAQHYDEKHAKILVSIYQYPDREALVLSYLDRASSFGI